MRKMSGNEDVSRFAAQPIPYPRWRVVWLEVARRRKVRERVARAPKRFGRLLRPKLAAVPDDGRTRAAAGGLGRQAIDSRETGLRKRTPRI